MATSLTSIGSAPFSNAFTVMSSEPRSFTRKTSSLRSSIFPFGQGLSGSQPAE